VARALEKDKGGTIARRRPQWQISEDAWDEPITARPASTAYQLRKFARRHKSLTVIRPLFSTDSQSLAGKRLAHEGGGEAGHPGLECKAPNARS